MSKKFCRKESEEETRSIGEAEELRGVGGVKVANLVGDDGEDAWEAANLGSLRVGEADGEAGNGVLVGVEDLGWTGVRERSED